MGWRASDAVIAASVRPGRSPMLVVTPAYRQRDLPLEGIPGTATRSAGRRGASAHGVLQGREGVLVAGRGSLVGGLDRLVDLGPVNLHVPRCVDAHANDVALDVEDADHDVVTDDEALADPSRENE